MPAPKPGLAGNTGEEWAECLLRALEKFHFLPGRREGDGTIEGGSQCWEKKLQVLLVLSAKQRVSSQRAGVSSARAECTVVA